MLDIKNTGDIDYMPLYEDIKRLAPSGLCVAFSGGVDSALLLALAVRTGGRVLAVTAYTPFHSPSEPEAAARLATQLGAEHRLLTLSPLPDEISTNPVERCYICKRWIFESIKNIADENQLSTVLDGTNADDLKEYRPGLKALKELGIVSPIASHGLTKPQVRKMAEALGISIAQKPSAPCFATRFPYNTAVDLSIIPIIDKLEHRIKELDIPTVRVRVYGDTLRIEVNPEDFNKLIQNRDEICSLAHKAGFIYITMDLEGFMSGSMDKTNLVLNAN